jgi:lipopolysaccharide/colanic/teichoic acid biosynthesis glycosyltransferase
MSINSVAFYQIKKSQYKSQEEDRKGKRILTMLCDFIVLILCCPVVLLLLNLIENEIEFPLKFETRGN